MKKLMIAALVAGSMVALADEPAKPVEKAAAAPVAVQKAPKRTPEQRAEMRAKREKIKAERRAKVEAEQLEVLKKYGIEGDKAKALLKELQDAMRKAIPAGFGRGMFGDRKRPMPAIKPATEQQKK